MTRPQERPETRRAPEARPSERCSDCDGGACICAVARNEPLIGRRHDVLELLRLNPVEQRR